MLRCGGRLLLSVSSVYLRARECPGRSSPRGTGAHPTVALKCSSGTEVFLNVVVETERLLYTSPSSAFFFLKIEALPEIVTAIKGRCQIFVDGGFSTGADIFKALALGADMVSIPTCKCSNVLVVICLFNSNNSCRCSSAGRLYGD